MVPASEVGGHGGWGLGFDTQCAMSPDGTVRVKLTREGGIKVLLEL